MTSVLHVGLLAPPLLPVPPEARGFDFARSSPTLVVSTMHGRLYQTSARAALGELSL